LSPGTPRRSGRDGSRPAPVEDGAGAEPGSDGGSGDGEGGSGGGGSGGGTDPDAVSTVELSELPPVPVDVPLPEIETPDVPPLAEPDSLPQVQAPSLSPAVLPSLDGD